MFFLSLMSMVSRNYLENCGQFAELFPVDFFEFLVLRDDDIGLAPPAGDGDRDNLRAKHARLPGSGGTGVAAQRCNGMRDR